MSRSLWKGPYVGPQSEKNKYKISYISRNSEIIPKFVGLTFKVYNGKKYIDLIVTSNMIGHKFGEFSFTRTNSTLKKK